MREEALLAIAKVAAMIFLVVISFHIKYALSEEITNNNEPIKLWQEQQLNCLNWCQSENHSCKENKSFSNDRCHKLNEECTNSCLKINTQTPYSD